MEVEKRQQQAGMESKDVETKQKQAAATETETKGMSTRSRRPSGGEPESKSQKVAVGDQATKPKVKMAKCSPEFIDWLLRMEKKPFRCVNLDLLEGYEGSYDCRGPMLRCDEAIKKLLDSNAEILRQYRATGVAYAEVVDEPSV
ncbi:unnamed protein product [Alopecurus aequalis]